MLKSYEDGMTSGEEGLHKHSDFALNHSTGEDSLSGSAPTGKFVPVSLEDTNPVNEEKEGENKSEAGKDE